MADSFRDLIVWQKSFELSLAVYRVTDSFPREDLYGLTSQMRRSSVSIPSNIAEGRHRGGRKEFRQFLQVAFGSGAELETQLEIAKELGRIDSDDYQKLSDLLTEVMKMLNVMIRKMSSG